MPLKRRHNLSQEEFEGWFDQQLEVRADGCKIWTRRKNEKGYGRLRLVNGGMGYANRVALERKLGRPIAPGMCALHSCDNPSCCNPDHLREGTNAENTQERQAKGRQSKGESRSLLFRGEKNGASKLTEEHIRNIIEQKGRLTQSSLAAKYGVSQSTVSRIHLGLRWKHIPREN
jgi:hypothetical protein